MNIYSRMQRLLFAFLACCFLTAVISAQPTIYGPSGAGAVDLGQRVTLSVGIYYATAPITYQWRKNSTNITGATSATYVINAASTNDAGTYGVIVNDATGSASSSNVDLVVNPPAAPVVTLNPANRSVVEGQSTSFTVYATGTYPRTYQWSKDGVPIAGATNITLSIAAVSMTDAGTYTVAIGNSVGATTSTGSVLTVTPATLPIIYNTYPYDTTATEGSSASLYIYMNSGSAPLRYQ